jgi:hypothetical protein
MKSPFVLQMQNIRSGQCHLNASRRKREIMAQRIVAAPCENRAAPAAGPIFAGVFANLSPVFLPLCCLFQPLSRMFP